MRINDDHMYQGAALTQIAEHPSFKSINAFAPNGKGSRHSFVINDDKAVFIKYATRPSTSVSEYKFGFTDDSVAELTQLQKKRSRVCVALVCVKDGEIVGLTGEEVLKLLSKRRNALAKPELQTDILVKLEKGSQARVYVNKPGRKLRMIGRRVVARNRFPGLLFNAG
jgi:hypothetical protein